MQGRTKLEKLYSDNASEFLDELAKETGVSREFLEEARPAINILFSEVPEEQRESCLVTVRDIVENQASAEQNIRRARLSADMLRQSQDRLTRRLNSLAQQTRQLATSFASLQLSLYQPPQGQLPN